MTATFVNRDANAATATAHWASKRSVWSLLLNLSIAGRLALRRSLIAATLSWRDAHLLEGIEVDVELFAVHRRQLVLNPFDVGLNPVQQFVSRLEDLPRVPLGDAAEERTEGDVRLADDGERPLAGDDGHGVGKARPPDCGMHAQADDRNDAGQRSGQRVIDRLSQRIIMSAVGLAGTRVVTAQRAVPGSMIRKGMLARQVLDDRHPVLERSERRDRLGKLDDRRAKLPAIGPLSSRPSSSAEDVWAKVRCSR